MSNFKSFKTAIAAHFAIIQQYPLFCVAVEKDALWDTYLNSFPAGSNPIYRERAEHDCSSCRSFVRSIGNVVAVIDGNIISLWDIANLAEPAYQMGADALSALVHSAVISDKFLHYERVAGIDKNFKQLTEGVKTWDHFFVNIDPRFVTKKADIASALAEPRESKNVLLRSLTEPHGASRRSPMTPSIPSWS